MTNERKLPAPQGGLNIQDLLLILFKHKWKIIILTLIGLVAAAYVYKQQKPMYESRTTLLVHYIIQRNMVDSIDVQRGAGGRDGKDLVLSQMEIVGSRDIALRVAEEVGIEKLLPDAGDGASLDAAAEVVLGGLVVSPGPTGEIFHISYANENPAIVQEVLASIVDKYKEKHLKIYRPPEAFNFVSQRVDQVRLRLNETEKKLNEIRDKAGVISLPERRAGLDTALLATQQELLVAEEELAVQKAVYAAAQQQAAALSKGGAPIEMPAPALIRKYQGLLGRLNRLQDQEMALAQRFKASNPGLQKVRADIKAVTEEVDDVEAKNPGLIIGAGKGSNVKMADPLELERLRVVLELTQKRVDRYVARIAKIEEDNMKLSEYGPQIMELERRRDVDSEKLGILETGLEKVRIDEKIDAKNMPGMNSLQDPTPPARRIDDKMKKLILAIAGSGFALGAGIAFLIELILNRGIRRPIELETQLQIPLLLSIPKMPRLKGSAGLLEYKGGAQHGGNYLTTDDEEYISTTAQPDHFILPYTDAIRDRLIFHFELHDMRHKPKLVALTGLSDGAGTSTLAAGLAMAFAGSDKAKVLLVDMSSGENGVNSAFPGLHYYSLPGALEIGRRDAGFSEQDGEDEENLFLAKVSPGRNADGDGSFAPRNLYDLMPDLRSSQYDYIIFDMPPVGLTSPTVSMAGLMDKVLLVLDSEKTDRDVLKRRYSELAQGKAHVSCVYNKVKRHAPKWVQGEV